MLTANPRRPAAMLVRIMLAFADEALAGRVRAALNQPHIHVLSGNGADTAQLTTGSYDLALFDALSSGAEGEALVERIRDMPDKPDVVVLRPKDDAEERAQLMAAGCRAVINSSVEDELLRAALEAVVDARREERLKLDRALRPRPTAGPSIVSLSPAMHRTMDMARKLAAADSPVLILGETGVGKELLATLLHAQGPRSRGPFVAVNCAAIPNELFESELFGHEKGAFTGAAKARRGQFELADQGTLFLDEVGEVPLALQAKLLRALQEGRVRPVGSERAIDVDVRIVTATNCDLAAEVEAGRFRRDLYYRLGVIELTIPPLRDRREDIAPLVERYLGHYREQLRRDVDGVDNEAMQALLRYTWPGNVRELVNVLERAVLLCEAEHIGVDDLPLSIAAYVEPLPPEATAAAAPGQESVGLPEDWLDRPWKAVREDLLREGERAYVEGVLRASRGRVGVAARRAGMSPRSLFEKMRRHGVRKDDFRDDD
jgi:DNA-binding NtrC family response regulator